MYDKKREGNVLSGVSFGKEVDHTVNVRRVAYIADLKGDVHDVVNVFSLQRKSRAVRQMIDKSFNF